MLTRESIEKLVKQLPDKFSADEIIERIIILQKVEIAQQQIANGEFLTEEEMDKEIDSWE